MSLSFIGRVKERIEGGYIVYLNASNINHIPVRDNVTMRKIYTDLKLTTGMYYINGCVETTSNIKKLVVTSCYSLMEIKETEEEAKEDIIISQALQEVILNKDKYPSDVCNSI